MRSITKIGLNRIAALRDYDDYVENSGWLGTGSLSVIPDKAWLLCPDCALDFLGHLRRETIG